MSAPKASINGDDVGASIKVNNRHRLFPNNESMMTDYSQNDTTNVESLQGKYEVQPTTNSRQSNRSKAKNKSETKTSMELRKLPTDVLLLPANDFSVNFSSSDGLDDELNTTKYQQKLTLVQKLCLNPKYTLKTQMMISFGLVNLLTILFVVAVCLLVTVRTGQKVKDAQIETFQSLTKSSLSITARYLAESLDHRMMPVDLVDIIYEATQDRFLGGLQESDQYVPFPDALTGENVYPVIGPDLYVDWKVPQMVSEENYKEHVQDDRWEFYKTKLSVSTASGVFIFQGACDPDADQDSPYYLEGCTDANNNITNGGSYNPSNLTKIVYQKGKDLVPVLKSIFEVNPHVMELGLYFKSGGNGATVNFPAYPLDSKTFYTSQGCDWMSEPNPLDPTRPIGTQEEIARCHGKGMNVSTRLYNPMERSWCQEQALNPNKTFVRVESDGWAPDKWHLYLGRAVYDRQSKDFLTCIYVGVSLDSIGEYLHENKITNNSHVSMIQLDQSGNMLATSFDATGESRSVITKESYQQIFDLIDYSKEWNATKVRQAYESHYIREQGYSVYAYPIPTVPAEYDPEYRPLVLILVSISDEDMLRPVWQVNDNVSQTVQELILFASVLGLIGLVVTTFIIFAMSKTLTAPLEDMNKATKEIIENFGSKASDDDADQSSDRLVSGSAVMCSPKTELHQVVSEYNKMVSNFSGSLMARTQKSRRVEIRNPFKCRDLFWELYKNRSADQPFWEVESKTDFSLGSRANSPTSGDADESCKHSLPYVHSGRNIISGGYSESLVVKEKQTSRMSCSPLFWWTVLLVVVPLVLFTASISAWVMVRIQKEFDENLENTKDYFLEIVLDALKLHASLRAQTVAGSSASSLRDLYMATRYMGWLAFGGLTRAESFTRMYSGSEQCKTYMNDHECPYYQEHAFCHCSWNDKRDSECTDDTSEDPRYRQIPYFLVQTSDALPNGNRTVSSFPEIDYSPNTTSWWDNALVVPGYEKGSGSVGFGTLYDRLRVSSAMPLFPVLYNYDQTKESFSGLYIGFEADGLFLGFRGCPGFEFLHTWKSTEGNGASRIRPELCPLGKYGYDPRCREWYDTGRKLASKGEQLYVTAPYTFADSMENGQSATSPLVDPATGEHVAQVLNDFRASAIYNILDGQNTKLSPHGFPVLIVVAGNRDENTVIGPGFARDEPAKKISEVVLPYECDKASCKNNVDSFKSIETMMRQPVDGMTQFQRTSGNGNLETVYIGYAPVLVRSIRPEDPSQFARGITDSYYQVYSIGLCETEDDLLEPFIAIEHDVDRQVNSAIAIIAAAIAVAIVAILYVSYFMTSSITEPMFYLLDLIRSINKMNTDDEPPSTQMIVGPREIVSVITTMETLYKVVRAANDAFGAGEIEKAYLVLVDALRLFKRLENDKAVGVASNNLGNLMTIMFQELKNRRDEKNIYGLSVKDIIDRGTRYFYDAIRLGEKAYDEFYRTEGWTARCLDFMQHLANRYFNRALFLLSVKNDHEKPDEVEELAIRDLQISRDMDLEVIGYRKDAGLSAENHAEKLFSTMIVRARGHNMLCELGYPDTLMSEKGYPVDWSLKQMYIDMFEVIRKEQINSGSTLFEEVNLVGRLQEAEGELIRFLRNNGEMSSAARVAVRMLMEDEYAFADSLSIAMDAIRDFVDQLELDLSQRVEVKHEIQYCKKSIYRYVLQRLEDDSRLSPVTDQSRHEGANVVSNSTRSANSTEEQSLVLWIIQHSSGGYVTMEDF